MRLADRFRQGRKVWDLHDTQLQFREAIKAVTGEDFDPTKPYHMEADQTGGLYYDLGRGYIFYHNLVQGDAITKTEDIHIIAKPTNCGVCMIASKQVVAADHIVTMKIDGRVYFATSDSHPHLKPFTVYELVEHAYTT